MKDYPIFVIGVVDLDIATENVHCGLKVEALLR